MRHPPPVEGHASAQSGRCALPRGRLPSSPPQGEVLRQKSLLAGGGRSTAPKLTGRADFSIRSLSQPSPQKTLGYTELSPLWQQAVLLHHSFRRSLYPGSLSVLRPHIPLHPHTSVPRHPRDLVAGVRHLRHSAARSSCVPSTCHVSACENAAGRWINAFCGSISCRPLQSVPCRKSHGMTWHAGCTTWPGRALRPPPATASCTSVPWLSFRECCLCRRA